MAGILKGIFADVTNESIEAGRVLWVVGVIAMIAYQGVAIWWKDQPFSAIEFGTGLGGILIAGGFGVAQKDRALAKVKEVTSE